MKKRENGHGKSTQADTEPKDSLEGRIVEMALAGEIARISEVAVQIQTERGLPVTFQRGNRVIKRHSDGREEVLGVVVRPKYRLGRGVAILPSRTEVK